MAQVYVWLGKGTLVPSNHYQEPSGSPKTITQRNGVIYRFKCTQAGCEEEYIAELGWTFGDRLKEHHRAPATIYIHGQSSQHCIDVDSFSIVGRAAHSITRTIKEAMFIRVNNSSLNRNLGKFQLHHIWDEVLQDTPAFHLKKCLLLLMLLHNGNSSLILCGRGHKHFDVVKYGHSPGLFNSL